MEPLELPFWPPHYSDEEIGQWLIEAWMVCHGRAKLLPGRSIPKWLAKKLTAVHPTKESGSITLAPLESALRRVLVDSDKRAAGKMLRAYMVAEFATLAIAAQARTGMRVRKPFDDSNRERSATSSAEAKAWQARAADLCAMPQHADKNKSDIARLIDPEQWNTIRRKIKKP